MAAASIVVDGAAWADPAPVEPAPAASVPADAVAPPTWSMPDMPAAAWPATVQSMSYVPAGTSPRSMVALPPGGMSPLSLPRAGTDRLWGWDPVFVSFSTIGPAGTSGIGGSIFKSANVSWTVVADGL